MTESRRECQSLSCGRQPCSWKIPAGPTQANCGIQIAIKGKLSL
jgi:hypothetical protein